MPPRNSVKENVSFAAGLCRKVAYLEYVDRFAHVEIDKTVQTKTSTPFSLCGLLFAVVLLGIVSWGQFGMFLDEVKTSRLIYAQSPASADSSVEVPYFGFRLRYNGRYFENRSFMKWSFFYRLVQNGGYTFDAPWYSLPSKSCRISGDLSILKGGVKPWEVEMQGGDEAICLDRTMAKDIVVCERPYKEIRRNKDWEGCEERVHLSSMLSNIQPNGVKYTHSPFELQGDFGDPEYWFLQVKLMRCDPSTSDVPCASDAEWGEFWKGILSLDVVMLDSLQPDEWVWNHQYYTIAGDRWMAGEMRMVPIEFREESNYFPSLIDPVTTFHGRYSYVDQRQGLVSTFGEVAAFYFRVGTTSEIVTKEYYSFEKAIRACGSYFTVLIIAFGIFCKRFNFVYKMVQDGRMGRGSRGQRPGQETETILEDMEMDEATKTCSGQGVDIARESTGDTTKSTKSCESIGIQPIMVHL